MYQISYNYVTYIYSAKHLSYMLTGNVTNTHSFLNKHFFGKTQHCKAFQQTYNTSFPVTSHILKNNYYTVKK